MNSLVQFFLIDHLTATAWGVLLPCLAFKVFVVTNCQSHPLYRESRIFTLRKNRTEG